MKCKEFSFKRLSRKILEAFSGLTVKLLLFMNLFILSFFFNIKFFIISSNQNALCLALSSYEWKLVFIRGELTPFTGSDIFEVKKFTREIIEEKCGNELQRNPRRHF
jgi:hypothetical protein